MHVDSFSGSAADLPPGRRSERDVLDALLKDGKLSVWDLSETAWLRRQIESLKSSGQIISAPSQYPWVVFRVVEPEE